jgi:TRAP-type C4-dicarboxylate transport system substrate-binding protein
MSFSEVYTALQSNVIDGAEDNELALTDNGHGDVCKYYSYDMHQMVPDIVLANYEFLSSLPEDELAIFEEGFEILNTMQRSEWEFAVEKAKEKAQNEQGVQFFYPDTAPFKEAVISLHEKVLTSNPALQPIYDKIQKYNEAYAAGKEESK